MKFLALDRTAVLLVVQSRSLLTSDYAQGKALSSLLVDGTLPEVPLASALNSGSEAGGSLIVANNPDREHIVVFDLEVANPFVGRPPEQSLAILQKALRFCLKIWNQQAFTPAEFIITGAHGSKYVLFPLGLASASHFRLTFDRLKQSSTGTGDHLLMFRAGKDEGKGADEEPSRSRFNSALSVVAKVEAKGSSEEHGLSAHTPESLTVTQLSPGAAKDMGIQVPYEDWLRFLTDNQRNFVQRPLHGAERLEGPAGTGKTLALMLKAYHTLKVASDQGIQQHAVFITHSLATRNSIEQRFQVIDPDDRFWARERSASAQSLTITTLQEWCAQLLGRGLAEVEYLDRDAAESKNLQFLYVEEAVSQAKKEHFETYRSLMSPEFSAFLSEEDSWHVAEMFQHEIGVTIKGRAEEELDRYKRIEPLKYGLPIRNEGDKSYAFLVYKAYQAQLKNTGQFDTDDIVLSSIKQLDTPIWRRRREHEGFDCIFVDETHLFNLNELSLVHFLARRIDAPSIAFAVDRSQAIGDRGASGEDLEDKLLSGGKTQEVIRMNTVFRSNAAILSLAQAVTAAGATLFTNFEDPLLAANSSRIESIDNATRVPFFRLLATDDALIDASFAEATAMAERLSGNRSGVALVVFDPQLLARFKGSVRDNNRPYEVLERRGDLEVINRAQAANRFVLAGAEYIGGLEFDGVVLAGVDEGRVPAIKSSNTTDAKHFMRYRAHNMLYVALTRARKEVAVLASEERGLSEILLPAVTAGLLERAE